MTGLSKITDKILEEARQDAAARLSQADRECSAISAEYAGKADKIRNDIFERARNEAAGIVSRAKSTENMEKRNTQLAAKSRMIELAYETAKKQIADLPEERMLSFLVMLLCAAVAQRAEAEETSLRFSRKRATYVVPVSQERVKNIFAPFFLFSQGSDTPRTAFAAGDEKNSGILRKFSKSP